MTHPNDPTEPRLLAAAREASRRAEEALERARRLQDAAERGHERRRRRGDEALAEPRANVERRRQQERIDVDAVAGTPEQQAAEFFARPGDFYYAELEASAPTSGKIAAHFMVKASDEELPLVLEVLRQVRGALSGRIELTKAHVAERAVPMPTIPDGPPQVIGQDFHLGPRYCGSCGAEHHDHGDNGSTLDKAFDKAVNRADRERTAPPFREREQVERVNEAVEHIRAQRAQTTDEELEELRAMLPGKPRAEFAAEHGLNPDEMGPDPSQPSDEQRANIAAQFGVPIDRVVPHPIRGGGMAYSIAPPPTLQNGRHARPDNDEENN